jgi:hypothetical protein
MLTMGQRRQAGQASVGETLPELPDGGVRLIVKVHLNRVSHPLTMPVKAVSVRVRPRD